MGKYDVEQALEQQARSAALKVQLTEKWAKARFAQLFPVVKVGVQAGDTVRLTGTGEVVVEESLRKAWLDPVGEFEMRRNVAHYESMARQAAAKE